MRYLDHHRYVSQFNRFRPASRMLKWRWQLAEVPKKVTRLSTHARDRSLDLGWRKIKVIDDNLDRSAAGVVTHWT